MKVLGVCGYSGAGKTSLIEALIPLLRAQGLRVSVIKHAHHGFDIDRPGKDSWRHREAGAGEVMLLSDRRWVLMHEMRDNAPPPVEDLIARLAPCDLVLLEGFKTAGHDKIEVYRPAVGKPPIWPEGRRIVAVACDEPIDCPLPVLDLNDHAAMLAFVLQQIKS